MATLGHAVNPAYGLTIAAMIGSVLIGSGVRAGWGRSPILAKHSFQCEYH